MCRICSPGVQYGEHTIHLLLPLPITGRNWPSPQGWHTGTGTQAGSAAAATTAAQPLCLQPFSLELFIRLLHRAPEPGEAELTVEVRQKAAQLYCIPVPSHRHQGIDTLPLPPVPVASVAEVGLFPDSSSHPFPTVQPPFKEAQPSYSAFLVSGSAL